MALEKVIRDAGTQTRGTIFCKSAQISAYADDMYLIISRTAVDLKEVLLP
jgi:hypothetical protein